MIVIIDMFVCRSATHYLAGAVDLYPGLGITSTSADTNRRAAARIP
jgi:hypothetical protein